MRIPSSYDIVGSALIFELPEGCSMKDARKIAEVLLSRHKNVRSVFVKLGERYGVYRLRKLKLVLGENKSVVTHRENKCTFRLNLRKVYYSPREQTERLRVTNLINEYFSGEVELGMVFFAGIGCYPILIAKRCPRVKKLVGIEINPIAVKYFRENIRLNRVTNCEVILGDVARAYRRFVGRCDFVIMPYPEGAYRYLTHAIRCLRDNGICFFYTIEAEKEGLERWKELVEKVAKEEEKKVTFLKFQRVLPYAPRKYKVRMDFKVMS